MEEPLSPAAHAPVLVTGGAGFIGAQLVRSLLASGEAPVVVLDKLTYAASADAVEEFRQSPRCTFVEGDICDGGLLAQLFQTHRFGVVFHLAAESHVDRSIDSPAPFLETNVLGTFRLLEAALAHWRESSEADQHAFRFLHVSTDEVYGDAAEDGGRAFTEATAYRPSSPYAASKASSDHFARAYRRTFGLPVLVTNCSNNYGPTQFPEKLIPLTVACALRGKPIRVYGDGGQIRDWLHVDDHCAALRLVAERGRVGETYLIGGRSPKTNLETVHVICDAVDRLASDLPVRPTRSLIEHVVDRPGHDLCYKVDCDKLEQELSWRPSYTFESGVAQVVQTLIDRLGVAEGVDVEPRLGLRGSKA